MLQAILNIFLKKCHKWTERKEAVPHIFMRDSGGAYRTNFFSIGIADVPKIEFQDKIPQEKIRPQKSPPEGGCFASFK